MLETGSCSQSNRKDAENNSPAKVKIWFAGNRKWIWIRTGDLFGTVQWDDTIWLTNESHTATQDEDPIQGTDFYKLISLIPARKKNKKWCMTWMWATLNPSTGTYHCSLSDRVNPSQVLSKSTKATPMRPSTFKIRFGFFSVQREQKVRWRHKPAQDLWFEAETGSDSYFGGGDLLHF